MRRQLDLFLPGPWSDPLPIHCWAVEHDGRVLLVDTGETADVRNVPFARFQLTGEQELPAALAGAGNRARRRSPRWCSPTTTATTWTGSSTSVLPCRSARANWASSAEPFSRLMRRVLRQPLPAGFAPAALTLGDGPFGAFASSRRLSADGRIVAVPTPGHTPGHISVICVDDQDVT